MQHRGKKVAAVVRVENITILELAAKLKKNRNTVYNWFRDAELSISKIKMIGKAIGHDFENEFPYLFKEFSLVLEPPESYESDTAIRRELNELYKKYSNLLEEHMALRAKIAAKNAQNSDEK
uniref:helix-turn-helix domain-containing protein n=1 Tax=Roseivirga sp. TaxID=1964215 RepID=UPI00404825CF